MPRNLRVRWMVTALVIASCAPSTRSLVRDGHWVQALHRVDHQELEDAERAEVFASLADRLGATIEVHVESTSEAACAGDTLCLGDSHLPQALVSVRLRHRENEVPVWLDAYLVQDEGSTVLSNQHFGMALDRTELAASCRAAVDPSAGSRRDSTTSTTSTAVSAGLAIATLGILRVPPGSTPPSEPNDSELWSSIFERSCARLQCDQALERIAARCEARDDCGLIAAFRREPTARLRLVVGVTLGDHDRSYSLSYEAIDLSGPSYAAAIAALGEGPRPLDRLSPYVLPASELMILRHRELWPPRQ